MRILLICLAALAALALAGFIGHRVSESGKATEIESAYVNGKAQGAAEGAEAGKQELRAGSEKWFCVNVETKGDSSELLFCLQATEARDAMCKQAMMAAEEDPDNMIVHGCPDIMVISETPKETPASPTL